MDAAGGNAPGAKRAKRSSDAPRTLLHRALSASSQTSDDEDLLDALPLSQTDNARPPSAGRMLAHTSLRESSEPAEALPGSALDSNDLSPGGPSAAHALSDGPSLWQAGMVPAMPRTIHDRIHGHIGVEAVLVAVMDTPEFQRLRDLKQLGGTVYVYPGACHTRFEHCLGVSHLAGLMVEHLMAQDGNTYGIDERDRLCVKLAGLCHDLGHGPFSHMFELFVNRVRESEGKPLWEHEDASMKLLDHLLTVNGVYLTEYGLRLPEDLAFVKLCIRGLPNSAPWPAAELGRPSSKRFLLDIVANKRNGIDVDKLDYFVRDSTAALGSPPIGCDIKRLIRSSRAVEVDGQVQVCFEEKMALGIFDIFRLRAWLHKYVYQHHTVNVIEEMICDVFTEANDHLRLLRGAGGTPCRISDAVEDMVAYARLGDWILNAIESTSDAHTASARLILQRLRCRDLYAAVYQPTSLMGSLRQLSEREVHTHILHHVSADADLGQLADDLLVHFVSINYGSRGPGGEADNPVLHVNFFNPKVNAARAGPLCERRMPPLFMPQAFEEKLLYVFSRSDESHAALEAAYKRWRRAAHLSEAAKADALDDAVSINGTANSAESVTPGGTKSQDTGLPRPLGPAGTRHRDAALTPIVTGNPASPSKAATRLARHASGGLPPKFGSPLGRDSTA